LQEKPWGNSSCSSCKGFCTGHYKTTLVETSSKVERENCYATLSSAKKHFSENAPVNHLNDTAKLVLLPEEECQIWLNHLRAVIENRKRGAQKAAATRKNKQHNQAQSIEVLESSIQVRSEELTRSSSIPTSGILQQEDNACTQPEVLECADALASGELTSKMRSLWKMMTRCFVEHMMKNMEIILLRQNFGLGVMYVITGIIVHVKGLRKPLSIDIYICNARNC